MLDFPNGLAMPVTGHCFILIWHELVRFGSSDCLHDLYQLPLCLEVDVVGRWYRANTGPDKISQNGDTCSTGLENCEGLNMLGASE